MIKNSNIDKLDRLQVFINGQEFIHFSTLSVTRSVENFIDTFSMKMNNPFWRYSTTIAVGSAVSIVAAWVEIFRGFIEQKSVALMSVGSEMNVNWREEILLLAEDDIDPQTAAFKNTTDNAIIQKVCTGYSWKLELWAASPIKEYTSNVGMKKAQVIEDVVRYNDYVIIKKGLTLYKKKIPLTPDMSPRTVMRMTEAEWKFSTYTSRILGVTLTEDISATRSTVLGYSYERWKKKWSIQKKYTNDNLKNWEYAKRLRNKSALVWYKIERQRYISTPAKELAELQWQVNRSLRETDIKIEVVVNIAGLHWIDLLDCVDVFLEQEKVLQYMYVSGVQYNLDASNKFTTQLTLKTYPKV